MEMKKAHPVHFPFSKNARKNLEMRFEMDKNMGDQPASVSIPAPSEDLDSIKNNKSLQLDGHNRQLIKNLERDSKSIEIFEQAEERLGVELERARQAKIMERLEFEKQIQNFNQKELLKVLMRKEAQEANKDYWNQQIEQTKAKN